MNDTIRILKDGRIQEYMQEFLTFQKPHLFKQNKVKL